MTQSFKNFIFGAITAVTVFVSLTLFSAALLANPSSRFGEGLAVLSARLGSLPSPTDPNPSSPPEKRPSNINPRLARELISLSGFGGWDIEAAPSETEYSDDDEGLAYPEDLSGEDGKIVRKTYTYHPSGTYLELPGGGLLRNCTDIDSAYLLEQASRAPDFSPSPEDGPLVLIMHTHTTESYEPEAREHYSASYNSRTTELDKSVAAVGEKIARELEAAGIGVIHDTTIHDYPHYTGAYDRSAVTVAEYLRDYPSIKIVIDVHRDAIEENSVRYAPVVDINGRQAAQVMIICGCTNVPQYRYNLRIASRLQSRMETDFPGLTRPILFDERNYNQEMTHGSFLIEMGSSANSLDEALYSGELVGKALAEVIGEGW